MLSFCIEYVFTVFSSEFELTFYTAYTPGPSQVGTNSHIATLTYFCDQANSPGPSETVRSAALLRPKL